MTRREWIGRAAIGLGVLAGGCRRDAPHRIGDHADGDLSPSTVDYATARKGFRTNLTRQGPAPDKAEMPRAVPGAVPFSYPSGGLQLVGWINPEARVASTRRPAVVFLHGGFAFGADHWEYARPFLRAGFHVLLPVLRAENQQPGCFSLFYDEVDDCLAATDAFSRLSGVDPGKLFLCGHVTGGTLALLTALTTDRFRACSAFSPSPSTKEFLRGQERIAPFDLTSDEEYRMRSPLAFAAHFRCPIRSFFGEAETDGGFKLAYEMGRHARGSEKDVGELKVAGDQLTAIGPATRATVGFFEVNGARS